MSLKSKGVVIWGAQIWGVRFKGVRAKFEVWSFCAPQKIPSFGAHLFQSLMWLHIFNIHVNGGNDMSLTWCISGINMAFT
jgi:hypothetical protein